MLHKRVQILILILSLWRVINAQTGSAGIEEISWIGFSARMMALAGAGGAAYPNDPSAFSWNPAGMRVVQQKSLGLSHTTFNFGTQYHSIGYLHPTLSAGTFGIGISRVGTDDVPHVKKIQGVPQSLGTFGYYWGKLSIAYAFPLFGYFSTGITFDAHRQVMGDIASNNGFGINYGLHFGSYKATGFLKHFYLGWSLTNIMSQMKLGTREDIPQLMRIGLTKGFVFRREKDHFFFFIDGIKHENRDWQTVYGMEYGIGKSLFFRTGYDGSWAVGTGLRIKGLQFDYASGQFSDDPSLFDRSHRFSVLFHLGKSIPDRIRQEKEARQKEIQNRYLQRLEEERIDRIHENLEKGKEYHGSGDYFNARIALLRVLEDDPGHPEAGRLLTETESAEQTHLQNKEAQLVQQTKEGEKQRQDQVFVDEHFQQGLDALGREEYHIAIEKWEEALKKDPDNKQILSYIEKARTSRNQKITQMIAQARRYMVQEKHSEAYKLLDQAKIVANGHESLVSRINTEIRRLDKSMDFISFYQAGLDKYREGAFESAAGFLEQALKIQPYDERARELHRNAMARVKAKKEPENVELKGDVRQMFDEGLEYYRNQKYEQALAIWEKALEINPHNIKLLQAVRAAKDRLQTYKK